MQTTAYSHFSGQPITLETAESSTTASRPCRIHRGGPEHAHRSVCDACLGPVEHAASVRCVNAPLRIRYITWVCVEVAS